MTTDDTFANFADSELARMTDQIAAPSHPPRDVEQHSGAGSADGVEPAPDGRFTLHDFARTHLGEAVQLVADATLIEDGRRRWVVRRPDGACSIVPDRWLMPLTTGAA